MSKANFQKGSFRYIFLGNSSGRFQIKFISKNSTPKNLQNLYKNHFFIRFLLLNILVNNISLYKMKF